MLKKVIFLSALLLLCTSAHAERVIVIMKNQSALFSGEPDFARKIEGAVEKTLPYVHSYIVNTKSEADFESLKNDPNIALVEKEVLHPFPALIHSELQDASQAPVVTVVNPGRPWGIDAIKAPLVWQKTQQGKGSRVLLLDSGIDKAHPALKDNFEAGRDFTTDNPQDFSDFKGHGTHVAGTIAGAVLPSGFSGVAPKAKILMARVCVENAGCMSSAILGALNWAISKKVDVINISIASINMTDAEKLAITKVDKAGISVVAATGNWGTERIFFPAILPTVVAVGAVDEQLQHASFSQYGPQLAVVAPGVNILSSVRQGTAHDPTVTLAWDNQSVKLTASSFGGTKDVTEPLSLRIIDCGMGAASDYVGKGVEGKFALVQRGGPKFIEKLEVAIKAKVAGVIFMNNEPGLLYGRVTDPGVTLSIPAFMIEQIPGEALKKALAQSKIVQATMMDQVSDFSTMDGTSQATPHVTGVIALMKSVNKKLKPQQIKSILMKTATPLGPNPKNQYGAGLINAEAAVDAALKAK